MNVRHTVALIVFGCTSLLPAGPAFAQFVQLGPKLVGAGAVGNAFQGRSVAISANGNTAIVGGTLDDGSNGAAWIWTRTGDVWTQQGSKLVGSGAVGNANQGNAVSISADGNTAIVGGPFDNNQLGAAWIWTRNASVWTQQGNKLVGSATGGNAQQGWSVTLSADGNTAIVGGPMDSNSSGGGAVWVFTRSGGVWSQQGNKLAGSGAVGNSSRQGYSVALASDGNTAIVGGYGDNAANGAAWVWTRSGTVWTQQGTKLVGSGAVSGVGNAWQGWSVSLSADGNTAIIGAVADNNNTGAVWIWTRSGGFWSQQSTKLTAAGNIGASLFSNSVALTADGNTAIVGGPLFGGASGGAVWIWTRSSGVWTEQTGKLIGSGNQGGAQQGNSAAISADGNTIIVGGPLDKGFAGAVWVFIRTGNGLATPRRHAVRR
jgi:antibiotic biosynthesis monooxygenase (ABM) superfamily enzyme